MRTREEFLDLRRAELSPLQIGDLHGRTAPRCGAASSARSTACRRRGVRRGYLTPRPERLLLDRQLRQVPRWLAQRRYNGPSGGRNRPDLPRGDVARRPGTGRRRRARDLGRLPRTTSRGQSAWARSMCRPRRSRPAAAGRGFALSAPSDASAGSRVSSYNSALSANGVDGGVRDRRVDVPARQARRPDVDPRARPAQRRGRARQPRRAGSRRAHPQRLQPVAVGRRPARRLRGDRPASAARPSRNGLFVFDRATRRERLLTGRLGGRGVPAADQRRRRRGRLHRRQRHGRRPHARLAGAVRRRRARRSSRAPTGRDGAPAAADAYEPSRVGGRRRSWRSRRARRTSACASRASKIVVRDLRAGTTRVVEGGAERRRARARRSRRDGRFVAYVLRKRTTRPEPRRLRSRVMLRRPRDRLARDRQPPLGRRRPRRPTATSRSPWCRPTGGGSRSHRRRATSPPRSRAGSRACSSAISRPPRRRCVSRHAWARRAPASVARPQCTSRGLRDPRLSARPRRPVRAAALPRRRLRPAAHGVCAPRSAPRRARGANAISAHSGRPRSSRRARWRSSSVAHGAPGANQPLAGDALAGTSRSRANGSSGPRSQARDRRAEAALGRRARLRAGATTAAAARSTRLVSSPRTLRLDRQRVAPARRRPDPGTGRAPRARAPCPRGRPGAGGRRRGTSRRRRPAGARSARPRASRRSAPAAGASGSPMLRRAASRAAARG